MKKIYTLSAAAVLALGALTGCGADKNAEQDKNTKVESSDVQKQDDSAAKKSESGSAEKTDSAKSNQADSGSADQSNPEGNPPAGLTENNAESPAVSQDGGNSQASSPQQTPGINIKAAEAYAKFSQKYPDAGIRKIELDDDNGKFIYKIKGVGADSGYVMKVDAGTGEVISDGQEQKDSEPAEVFSGSDMPDIDSIVQTALNDAGAGYSLKNWSMKIDSNTLMMEIELADNSGNDIEYKIDAMTGGIIEKN